MNEIEADLRENFEEFFVQAFSEMLPGTELDFAPYLRLVCDRFQNLRQRDRIVFNVPARSLKSWSVKFFCAWYLGRHPSRSIMFVSNTQKLAERNLDDVREIVASDWFRKVFPGTRIKKGRSSADQFATTRRGGVLAASVHGSVAGFGADLLILDDPNKISHAQKPDQLQAVNDKFDGELYSRLNNKKKSIVVCVQHRLAPNDLSGHLIRLGFKVIAFPLVAARDKTYRFGDDETWHRAEGHVLSSTYTAEDIEAAKRSSLDFFWFCQQGIGPKYNAIRMEDFKLIDSKKADGPFVISIDAAQSVNPSSSYSVVQAWQQRPGGSLHLFQQFRAQCAFVPLLHAAKSFIKQFQPAVVLIETGSSGEALLSALQCRMPNVKFKPIKPIENKVARLGYHRETIRQGKLSLQSSGDWLVDFLLEFAHFPNRGTDIVDATTQMLDYAEENPIWPRPQIRMASVAGVGSDGRPILASSPTESGPRGIAMARGRSFFRRF